MSETGRHPAPAPPTASRRPLRRDVAVAQARDILTLVLLVRIANALCLRTFFQPDEYFQALEPAWRVAFGPDSGAWLTWVWRFPRAACPPTITD